MILLLDTSSAALTIGLSTSSGSLVGEFQAVAGVNERGIHDHRLASETAKLLQSMNVTPSEIERIGIVIGPGSFTGLRIGVSFVKGFASARAVDIVTIVTHELYTNQDLPQDALIVLPSYNPSLVYVSTNGTPREVQLKDRKEVPSAIAPQLNASHRLNRMLALTLAGSPITDLAEFEPLYVTEFAAGRSV